MVLKSCSAKCPTHLKKNDFYQFYSLKKIGLSTKYNLQFPEDDSLSPFALTSRLRQFHNTRYFLWDQKALLYPLVPVFPLISYYTCFSSWDNTNPILPCPDSVWKHYFRALWHWQSPVVEPLENLHLCEHISCAVCPWIYLNLFRIYAACNFWNLCLVHRCILFGPLSVLKNFRANI